MSRKNLFLGALVFLASCGAEAWPTYLNERFEYAVTIPPGWSANEELANLGIVTFYSPELQKVLNANPDPEGRVFDVAVTVFTTPEDLANNTDRKLPFEEWVKTPDVSGVKDPVPAVLSAIDGYRWTHEDGSVTVMVPASNRLYSIGTDGPPTETEEDIIRRFIIVNPR